MRDESSTKEPNLERGCREIERTRGHEGRTSWQRQVQGVPRARLPELRLPAVFKALRFGRSRAHRRLPRPPLYHGSAVTLTWVKGTLSGWGLVKK